MNKNTNMLFDFVDNSDYWTRPPNIIDKHKKIITCIGCSLTYGSLITEKQAYPNILNNLVSDQYQVLNLGFAGAGLKIAIGYYKYCINKYKINPELCILQIPAPNRQYDILAHIQHSISDYKKIIHKKIPMDLNDPGDFMHASAITYKINSFHSAVQSPKVLVKLQQYFISLDLERLYYFQEYLKLKFTQLIIVNYKYVSCLRNNMYLYNDKVKEFSEFHNIPLINDKKLVVRYFEKNKLLTECYHFNILGAKIIACIINEYLKKFQGEESNTDINYIKDNITFLLQQKRNKNNDFIKIN